MEPTEAEAELVERSRGGDLDAYGRLVETHQRAALRVAYVLAGSDAEDAVQEAFVKAHRQLHRFRSGAPFRPWLLTIVANEARNRRRSAGRRSALALRVANRAETGPVSPEDAAVMSEARQRLLDAVATLPQKDREIVALRFFAGLSEAETASALGCPVGTAKSRLSRALTRMRTELGEELVS